MIAIEGYGIRPLKSLVLLPELAALDRAIERLCAETGTPVESLLTPRRSWLPCLCDGKTIIGNWPLYKKLLREGAAEAPILESITASITADPPRVVVEALASPVVDGNADPLLTGLIYRRFADYMARAVPLRVRPCDARVHREIYGCSRRQYYRDLLLNRLQRSLRDLQRYASILDLPAILLRRYRERAIPLVMIEKICFLDHWTRTQLLEALSGVENPQEIRRRIHAFLADHGDGSRQKGSAWMAEAKGTLFEPLTEAV